jgi:hypothetical protein
MGIVTSRKQSLTSTPRLIRVKAKDEDCLQANKYQPDSEASTTQLPEKAAQSLLDIFEDTTDVLPNRAFQVDFFYFYKERLSLTALDKYLVSEEHDRQPPKQMYWIVKPVKAERGLLPTFSVLRCTTDRRSFYKTVETKEASSVNFKQDNRGRTKRAKMVVTFDDDEGKVTCKLVLQRDVAREDAEQGWILTGKMYQDTGRSWTAFIAKAKLAKQKGRERNTVSLTNIVTEEEHSPTRDSAM